MSIAMTETEELLKDLKAVYAEQNPKRNRESMQYTEAMLALGTLLRREIRLQQPITTPEPELNTRFTLRGQIIVRLARFDPRDPE